jgi:hypothetical protein
VSQDELIERATDGLAAPDALQMAAHLAELYWPEATHYTSGHVAALRSQLRALYARWKGRAA